MIVKNTTILSAEKATEILIRNTVKDYKKKYLYLGVILLIGISTLIIGLAFQETNAITMGAIFLAVGVGFFIYTIIELKRVKPRVIKNNPEVTTTGISFNYTFRENSVTISAKIGDKTKNIKYTYQELKAIKEYSDGYEVVFNQSESIYVLKEGFESPKMEEFFRKNITTTKKKIKLIK